MLSLSIGCPIIIGQTRRKAATTMLTTKRRKITRGGVAKYFGIAKTRFATMKKLIG
jgi:hypothetical protein